MQANHQHQAATGKAAVFEFDTIDTIGGISVNNFDISIRLF